MADNRCGSHFDDGVKVDFILILDEADSVKPDLQFLIANGKAKSK